MPKKRQGLKGYKPPGTTHPSLSRSPASPAAGAKAAAGTPTVNQLLSNLRKIRQPKPPPAAAASTAAPSAAPASDSFYEGGAALHPLGPAAATLLLQPFGGLHANNNDNNNPLAPLALPLPNAPHPGAQQQQQQQQQQQHAGGGGGGGGGGGAGRAQLRRQRRPPPGPPAPPSWSMSLTAAHIRSGSTTAARSCTSIPAQIWAFCRNRPLRIGSSLPPGAPLPAEGTLLHMALKQLAQHWAVLRDYHQQDLPFLPTHLKMLVLSYLAVHGPAWQSAAASRDGAVGFIDDVRSMFVGTALAGGDDDDNGGDTDGSRNADNSKVDSNNNSSSSSNNADLMCLIHDDVTHLDLSRVATHSSSFKAIKRLLVVGDTSFSSSSSSSSSARACIAATAPAAAGTAGSAASASTLPLSGHAAVEDSWEACAGALEDYSGAAAAPPLLVVPPPPPAPSLLLLQGPTPRFPSLTHLSLSHPGPSASWRGLLSVAPYLAHLTHLSLAYWPTPAATTTTAAATTTTNRTSTATANAGAAAGAAGNNTAAATLNADTDIVRRTAYLTMSDAAPFAAASLASLPFLSSTSASSLPLPPPDWSDAAGILRRLSRATYCLKWLNLEGCHYWLDALCWRGYDSSSSSGGGGGIGISYGSDNDGGGGGGGDDININSSSSGGGSSSAGGVDWIGSWRSLQTIIIRYADPALLAQAAAAGADQDNGHYDDYDDGDNRHAWKQAVLQRERITRDHVTQRRRAAGCPWLTFITTDFGD